MFEHEVGLPVKFFQAVDGGDVRMTELGQHLGFALESRQPLVVLREPGGQALQVHIAVQAVPAWFRS
jgi:hypothetical protein